MSRVRCRTCAGKGKVMGGGMMEWECEACDGSGKVYDAERSRREAIGKIRALDPTMTDEEATKIFDEESAKLDKGESDAVKKGRKKEQV